MDKLKEIETNISIGGYLDGFVSREDANDHIIHLVKEVKKLRKLVPKDNRNMKTWRLNFDNLWACYPEKKGKHDAWLKFKTQVKTVEALLNITNALRNYIADMERVRKDHPERPWLHGSTWFNHRWEDFIDYQAPGVCAKLYTPNKVEASKPEECIPPDDLKNMLKDFNRSLKSTPRASNKFVEPL
jgi:hypothetical protein